MNISNIKTQLLLKYPFFGSVVANFNFIRDNSSQTIEIIGNDLHYNPGYIASLSNDEQIFIFAHESCHIAFNHKIRGKGKEKETWNLATDAVINAFLHLDGLNATLGSSVIKNADRYDAETLYEMLKAESEDQSQESQENNNQEQDMNESLDSEDQQDEQQDQDESDTEDCSEEENDGDSEENEMPNEDDQNGEDEDDDDNESEQQGQEEPQEAEESDKSEDENKDQDGDSEDSIETVQQQNENQQESSQNEQQNKGSEDQQIDDNNDDNNENNNEELETLLESLLRELSGGGETTNSDERLIDNIGYSKPLIDWRYILKEAVNLETDWSYQNADVEEGVITPYLEEMTMAETEIVIDTSQSVSDVLLKNFLRECKNILQNSKVRAGCFDTKFYGFHELRNETDIEEMEYTGGGGTDFDVAADAFSQRVENKIIFTDGEAQVPDKEMDIIWIVYGNEKIYPKGGKVIYISPEDLRRLSKGPETKKKRLDITIAI